MVEKIFYTINNEEKEELQRQTSKMNEYFKKIKEDWLKFKEIIKKFENLFFEFQKNCNHLRSIVEIDLNAKFECSFQPTFQLSPLHYGTLLIIFSILQSSI